MRTFVTNIINKKLFSSTFLFLFFFCAVNGNNLFSEWCTPVVTQTFNHGIRNVTINGSPEINRTSGLAENYVYTNQSTTLTRGVTYSGSILLGFGVICSAGNVRVWIDFNRDYDFDDPGEMVFTIDNQSSNVVPLQFNINVPNDAYLGTTRMRITSKMQVSCGHTMPSSCNDPPDPVGYHGEIEDYDVIIINPVGLIQINSLVPDNFALYQNYPNPFNPSTEIRFDVPASSSVNITVYDMNGKEAAVLVNEMLSPGKYQVDWNAGNFSSGLYIYKITSGNFAESRRMILVK